MPISDSGFALYRQLRRERVLISNRFMASLLLNSLDEQIAGAVAWNCVKRGLLA
jgi:hypothetical protein